MSIELVELEALAVGGTIEALDWIKIASNFLIFFCRKNIITTKNVNIFCSFITGDINF